MAKLRVGTSYWLDQFRGRAPRLPSLRGTRSVDVAIVGGGITGCLAAYLMAEAGLTVLLLEAQRIARGSTAASTALLMQEPDVDFSDLPSRYGTARTRRIWARSSTAVRGFVELLRRLRLSASLKVVPSVFWTADGAKAADLRRELRRRQAAGFGGRWLTPAALRQNTGIDGAGGILTRGNAQVDPYRACLGIAQHAGVRGVEICEHSPAHRVTGTRSGVHIELENGEVKAEWAVIATGYATADFKPLAGRFRMSNTYVVGTAPIADATRRAMGLRQVMLWDTETPYHYARWTPDGRLLFGGEDHPALPQSRRRNALDQHTSALKQDLVALYPALEGIRTDYAWEGLFATTADVGQVRFGHPGDLPHD
ncbi:MAG: FAD-binding oxidoreductase, partial [Acidobacteriota bacterium]